MTDEISSAHPGQLQGGPGGSTTRVSGDEDPLAIVGIGCRLPGAPDTLSYWDLLTSGTDAVTETPKDRWGLDRYFDPDPDQPGKTISRWGGYLHSVTEFDWRAFHISPREAKLMDPQHRLLLEVAWEAFEDAGIPVENLSGSDTAVYIGIMWNDYAKLAARDYLRLEGYHANANSFAYAANRISYFLNLNGPSVAIDLQCASSLASVHLACRSIWDGEANLALAGGVNLILAPDTNIAMAKAAILSPTGRCRTWDTSADGFVRGEGCGLVIIKPMERALADGDRIYAIIRSSVLTHAGKTDWIMEPSRQGQEALLRRAYAKAGIDPREVDYIELHGTGTRVGDPIEAAALGSVVGRDRPGEPCRVGSAKTNIGHLDSAAAVAGLIKTALAVHFGQIPPSLHLNQLNPAIPVSELGLTVQTELSPWPVTGHQRTAGVTALSFGGGQCHVVLTEAPEPARSPPSQDPKRYVIPLSASSDDALRSHAGNLARYLATAGSAVSLTDICYTAAMRRSVLSRRAAVVAQSRREAAQRLEALAEMRQEEGIFASAPGSDIFSVVFLFPHVLGAEQAARRLAGRPGLFGDHLAQMDQIIRQEVNISLLGDSRAQPKPIRQVTELLMALVLQVGLAEIVRSWGVYPAAIFGEGIGEVSALLAAGFLMPAEAVRATVRLAELTVSSEVLEVRADQQVSLRRLSASTSTASPASGTPVFAASAAGPVDFGPTVRSDQAVSSVDYRREVEVMLRQGAGSGAAMLHFGPRSSLAVALEGTDSAPTPEVGALPAEELDDAWLASVAAFTFAHGANVDWTHILHPGRVVSLPHRSWRRERLSMEVSEPPRHLPENTPFSLPSPVLSGDYGQWRWEIQPHNLPSGTRPGQFGGGTAGLLIEIIRSCVDISEGWEPFALRGFAVFAPLYRGDESTIRISLTDVGNEAEFVAERCDEPDSSEPICTVRVGPALAEPRQQPMLTYDLIDNRRSETPGVGSDAAMQVITMQQDEREAMVRWVQEAPGDLTRAIGPATAALVARVGAPGAELVRAREIFVHPRMGTVAIVHWHADGNEDARVSADMTLTDERGNVVARILGGEFSSSWPGIPSPTIGTLSGTERPGFLDLTGIARSRAARGWVLTAVSGVLGVTTQELLGAHTLADMGFDSLMAEELSAHIMASVGLELAATDLPESTVEDIIRQFLKKLP